MMDKRRWRLLAWGLMGAGLAVGMVALGGFHTVWVRLVALLMLGAAIAAPRGRSESTRTTSWIALGFTALGIVSLTQLIPLPPALHGALSSTGFGLWEQGWQAAFGEAPPGWWRPLSLDPAATADRALRAFTLALAAFAAVNLRSRERERPTALLVGLALGGAALAQLRAWIWSGAPNDFWGVYTTSIPLSSWTTFVNTNQGAALFGLAALMSVGAASTSKTSSGRVRASVAGLACVVGALVLRSDGVFIALVLAGLAGAAVYMGARAWSIGLAAVGLAGVAFVLADAELSTSLDARVDLTLAALRASVDHWLVGSGAGSVRHVLVPYASDTVLATHNAPVVENDPVEWLLTLGWPAALLVLAVFGASVLTPLRQAAGQTTRVAGALLFATWVYAAALSLMHFPSFIIGLGAPLVFAFETTSKKSYAWKLPDFKRPGARWTLRVAAVGVCASGALTFALTPLPQDGLAAHLEREGALADAISSTPSNTAIYAAEASQAVEREDLERARRLMARAFALDPRQNTRVLYAEVSHRAGAPEDEVVALLAPLFASGAPNLPDVLVGNVLAALPEASGRVALLDTADVDTLERFVRRLERLESRGGVEAFLVAMIERRPDDVFPKRTLARIYLDTKRPELAEIWLVLARDDHPEDVAIFASYLEMLLATERAERADALLWGAVSERADEPLLLELVLGWWGRTAPDFNALDATKSEVLGAVSSKWCVMATSAHRAECARLELWIVESRGDYERAARLHEIWARRMDNPSMWASFLARRGQCIALQRASARWRPREPANAERAARIWAAQLEACRAPE